MPEFSKKSPEHTPPSKTITLLKVIGHTAMCAYDHAAYVYDQLPRHRGPEMPLFGLVEQEAADSPQPLHPDITTTMADIHEVLGSRTVIAQEHLSLSNKFIQSTWMTQFTDRLTNHDPAFIKYSNMKELKDRFVSSAEQQTHPLSFAQQLDIALELADSNITEALTKLWLSSRQYARWLDSASISGLPDMTAEEIIAEMKEWREAILACKNADEENFQDTSGDSYYAWTHARARVMFGSEPGAPNQIGKFLFERGTKLNKRRVIKQTIPSNHIVAARYGNHIGDAILDAMKTK